MHRSAVLIVVLVLTWIPASCLVAVRVGTALRTADEIELPQPGLSSP